MPGSSLWLIPPSSSPLFKAIQHLITTVAPSYFPNVDTHNFIPHITITSEIDTSIYGEDPTEWLRTITVNHPSTPPLSQSEPEPILVTLEALEAGVPFFKKLTLKAEKQAPSQLLQLVTSCRAAAVEHSDTTKAETWARQQYLPHLSLMYADIPASTVENHLSSLAEECEKLVRGIMSELETTASNSSNNGTTTTTTSDNNNYNDTNTNNDTNNHHHHHKQGTLLLCTGGTLILVNTSQPISEWTPIAARNIPHIHWIWTAGNREPK